MRTVLLPASLLATFFGFVFASVAVADSSLLVDVKGARAAEVTPVLSDKALLNLLPNRSANTYSWPVLPAGSYSLGATYKGKSFGTPASLVLVDGVSAKRELDSVTGEFKEVQVITGGAGAVYGRGATDGTVELVTKPSTAGGPLRRERGWFFSAGLGAGYADTKVDSSFNSVFGSGSKALDESGSLYSLELLWDGFGPPTQQQQQAKVFGVLGYQDFNGLKASSEYVNAHPGLANDSGTGFEISRSLRLGAGLGYRLTPKSELAFLLGVHWTDMKGTVISDETSGGGPRNEFNSKERVSGPWAGIEASWRLPLFGKRSKAFLRYEYTRLDDFQVSGRSSFTGATYTGRLDAESLNSLLVGLRVRLGPGDKDDY